MCCRSYLTVQTQHHKHGEEQDGPQRGHWQLANGLRIS